MKFIEICGKEVNPKQIVYINVDKKRHDKKIAVLFMLSNNETLHELFDSEAEYLSSFDDRKIYEEENDARDENVTSPIFSIVYNKIKALLKGKGV